MATPKKKTPVKKTVSKANKTVKKVVKGKKQPKTISFESYGTIVFTILSLLFLSLIIVRYL